MSKSTISTFELLQLFPDQESARLYFEAQRWPDGVTCPACGEAERIGTRKGGFYRCNACLTDFTVRTNTIFKRSKVPLHKWLYAMHLLAARKGISSLQLHSQIGVTQKTAWFMLQRLREACGARLPPDLQGLDRMTEKVRTILDAVTAKVFAYRPNGDPKPLPKTAQPCSKCGAKAGYA